MFKYRLGAKVRSLVSGFEGIVTGRCQYISGCVQYLVKPHVKENGEMADGHWLDENALEYVDGGLIKHFADAAIEVAKGSSPPGGPQSEAPSTSRG